MKRQLICDFCSAPDPTHRLETLTFEVVDPVPGLVPMESLGDFLACGDCYALIVAGDEEGLVRRTRTAILSRYGYWHPDAEKILRAFHEQFRAHRLRVKP